jgi:hypothetical protein
MQNESSLLGSEIKKIIPSHLRLRARFFLLAAVLLLFLLSAGGRAFAGSATWALNPQFGDWYIADNWTPPTVPNGPGDTATFDVSNITDITVLGGSLPSLLRSTG